MNSEYEMKKNYILKSKERIRYNSSTAVIQLPHYKYVDKVLRSSSYEELMWRFMEAESPAKEISESYAAFSNMKKVCRVDNFTWLHIGDGGYTRTAAIFAFFSKSLNFSIDPAINEDKYIKWVNKYNVTGIYSLKGKFEDFSKQFVLDSINFENLFDDLFDINYPKKYNICCVHAHVKLEEVDQHFPNWSYLYTNPCCIPQQQTFSDDYMDKNHIYKITDKDDMGILSERRRVIIYKKLRPIIASLK